jgi:hypothetical protein
LSIVATPASSLAVRSRKVSRSNPGQLVMALPTAT